VPTTIVADLSVLDDSTSIDAAIAACKDASTQVRVDTGGGSPLDLTLANINLLLAQLNFAYTAGQSLEVGSPAYDAYVNGIIPAYADLQRQLAGVSATGTRTSTAAPTTAGATAPPSTAATLAVEGSGDAGQAVEPSSEARTASITYSGQSNFAVKATDANLESLDLLVNEIGSYQGTMLLPDGTMTSLLLPRGRGRWQSLPWQARGHSTKARSRITATMSFSTTARPNRRRSLTME